jgi:anaphase-promoting complex subunit 2
VYAERFRHLKAPRKLKWRHSLGLVELTLTIGNAEPLDFRVTPAHAALLLQFSDDSPAASAAAGPASPASTAAAAAGGVVLSAGQLSVALGVPVPVVRRKAMFWVAAGVLLEQRGKGGEIAYSRATSIDPSRIGELEGARWTCAIYWDTGKRLRVCLSTYTCCSPRHTPPY